jgi:hypothetical protein
MKRAKLIILILVIGSFVFVSCHKYPEDPFISFRKPPKRIEGKWNITSYQIWGVDHSHNFDSLLKPNTLYNCCINFSPYHNSNGGIDNNGTVTFTDLNNNLLYPAGNTGYAVQDGYRAYTVKNDKDSELTLGNNWTSADSTFFSLLVNNEKTTTPSSSGAGFHIMELYGKHLHISTNNGIDIYFKKQ